MRAKRIKIDPDAADPNGIYTAAAVGGAGDLTLAGALVTGTVATMDYARQIVIDSAGNDAGITFTVTGTNSDGGALSEVITGGNTAAVESTEYFKTITSIAASGAADGNVTIGTVDEFVSQTIPLNNYSHNAPTVSIEEVTGTIDFSIEQTYTPIWGSDTLVFRAASAATLTAITAIAFMNMDAHITGIRFVCNSYTTGADVSFVINQDG